MNRFTEQAVNLLSDGQRLAAAALFDAARMLKLPTWWPKIIMLSVYC